MWPTDEDAGKSRYKAEALIPPLSSSCQNKPITLAPRQLWKRCLKGYSEEHAPPPAPGRTYDPSPLGLLMGPRMEQRDDKGLPDSHMHSVLTLPPSSSSPSLPSSFVP